MTQNTGKVAKATNGAAPSSPLCGARVAHSKEGCVHCHIRHLTICGAFEPRELEHIERIVGHKELKPGQRLFEELDAPDYAYNLVEGTIRLYKLLADGRRQITGFAIPGDFLGLAAHGGYSYSAEAVTDAVLCRFRRPELSALFEKFPQMERRMLGVANDELAAAQDQMLLLGRKTPTEKVASFLLSMSGRFSRVGYKGDALSLSMTRADIADYLGLTVETVSRTFSKLKASKIIALPVPDQVQLLSLDRLEDIASGDAEA